MRRTHAVDLLFTLALFCVFAASSLLVIIIGARVYQNTVSAMDQNFDTRTTLTYVATKVRQNDEAGGVYVDAIEGIPALVLEQPVGENIYQTWIYHYDGKLCELLVRKGSEFSAAAGQPIVEIGGFGAEEVREKLFRITTRDVDGNQQSMLVGIRSAGQTA